MKVSICITTYNRPIYLKIAIESCLSQTLLPYEIIIGDDSNNDETKNMIDLLPKDHGVIITYHHHKPSLKQAENTNFIYKHAKGDKLVLLHDDDLLIPEAIDALVEVFKTNTDVDIAYGNQYFISDSGDIDYEKSPKINKYYFREKKYEGSVLASLDACILQQLPSNGYMIDAKIAKKILWRTHSDMAKLGNGNEMDWVLRLGLAKPKMYYVDKYLSQYRVTEESLSFSSSDDSGYKAYFLIKNLPLNIENAKIISLALKRKAPIAIVQALKLGKTKDAFNIFISKYHFSRILTLGYYKRLLLLIMSLFKMPINTKNESESKK